MITYEHLLMEADSKGLLTKEKNLPVSKGRIKGNRIAIKKEMSEIEKKCVMAEELGHYYTGTGDILDQSSILNRKQERFGRVHAYDRLIGLMGVIDAYKHRGVTEEFLEEALSYYKGKYGVSTKIDNYVIFFEPTIAVLELTD